MFPHQNDRRCTSMGSLDGYMGWGTSILVFGGAGSGGQANCCMVVMLGTFVVSSILIEA